MKITKQVRQIVEVELSLPAYFKKGYSFYKITSPNSGVEVSVWDNINSMQINSVNYKYRVEEIIDYEPCTIDDFNNAFSSALEMAAKLAEKHIEQPLQAEHSYLITENNL